MAINRDEPEMLAVFIAVPHFQYCSACFFNRIRSFEINHGDEFLGRSLLSMSRLPQGFSGVGSSETE
jgi:hypothetical protein